MKIDYLEARALNKSIANDKYQMANSDNPVDMIAEKLDKQEAKPGIHQSM